MAHRVALLTLTLLSLGCIDGPVAPELAPTEPPDARFFVTGDALANLDSNGHFQLPVGVADDARPVVGEDQAGAIALAVIRQFFANPNVLSLGSGSTKEFVEREHGGPIDWDRARLSDRPPYFARSHLHPLPDSLGAPWIRHYGPHYLVPVFVDATPVAVVGVAAYATNLFIDERGFVDQVDRSAGGNEFRVSGIPMALGHLTLPPSPEHAAEFAFQKSGRRIVAVPVLGTPGNRVSRSGARWHLELESPATFERVADGLEVTTSEVYVGSWCSIADARLGNPSPCPPQLRLFVAAGVQPAYQDVAGTAIAIRPDYAVDLHEVRVRQ